MLNSNNTRELAYVVFIDKIEPIPKADRVELASVGGWHIMVRKDQFKPGDPAIYFEIDSKVPETEAFEFLAPKHYKVKTQKYFKGTVISQGLLMAAEDFGWTKEENGILDAKGELHTPNTESAFLTKQLGVTYADAEDNKRKANSSADKYKKMAARHPELFKKKSIRWLMKRNWGKKLLFLFFGKKKDKRSWPQWVVKTDEERCQNMPFLFTDEDWHNTNWIVTEKIDGTSTTFTMKKNGRKYEYLVCSRNVCFDTPEKAEKCFYESNVYLEMSEKYHIQEVLKELFLMYNNDTNALDFITLQGETYGDKVQNRTYGLKEHRFAAFNLIFGYADGRTRRCNSFEMQHILSYTEYTVPCVPILEMDFKLPDTCDELLELATGKSALDDELREGFVLRDTKGERSFKAVSNEFLMKYHQ